MPKKKLYLNLGISLGIVLALFVLNSVLARDATDRLTTLTKLQSDETFRQDAVQALVTLQKDSVRADRYRNALQTILPSQDDVLSIQKDFRNLAKSHTLTSFTFSFGAEQAGTAGGPSSLSFQFSARGAFTDFIAFMKEVESSSYLVAVDSLNLTFGQKDINASVRGKVFFNTP